MGPDHVCEPACRNSHALAGDVLLLWTSALQSFRLPYMVALRQHDDTGFVGLRGPHAGAAFDGVEVPVDDSHHTHGRWVFQCSLGLSNAVRTKQRIRLRSNVSSLLPHRRAACLTIWTITNYLPTKLKDDWTHTERQLLIAWSGIPGLLGRPDHYPPTVKTAPTQPISATHKRASASAQCGAQALKVEEL